MIRFVTAFAALVTALPTWAQSYPDKPVRMVVPVAAGGPLDVMTRVFSTHMAEKLGQSFLVENRLGAGGSIGMDAVARAQPDGLTLLWALDSMLTVNPIVYPKFGEPLERLRPIAIVGENVSTLAVHPSLGVRTTAEFIKMAAAKDLSYGSAGPGSPGHRYMEFFQMLTGAKLAHIPYKGNAPAVQSLIGGETQAFITPIAGVLPHVRAGKLRALAVTSPKRTATLPDVPTMAELGYPRFVHVAWFSVHAPAKTPQPVIDIIERELQRVIQLPDVRERMSKAGTDPAWENAKTIVARAGTERKLWAEVIEKTGMKVE